MPVDDVWYLTSRGPDGQRLKSKKHGRGKRWRVRYTDDAGEPRERLFERKADADRYDSEVRADVSRGLYVDPTAGKVTVAGYFDEWRRNQLHRDSTTIKTEWALRAHIAPTTLGQMPIGQTRRSHVLAWVKDRAQVLAPSSLHPVYAYLAGMFKAAALDRVIAASPCQGIKLPELTTAERHIATTEQVHALVDGIAQHYRPQPYLAAGCGLRQGEVWGLELEHIDWLRREIHVRQQLKTVSGRRPYLAPPKTSTSVRTIELPDEVSAELSAHIKRHPVREVEIDDETDPRKPRRRMARLLFLNADGNPIHRGSFSAVWLRAVEAAGAHGLPAGYGFHALRHYYATLLIHGGASVTTVQLALGHANPTITLNTYAGLWPEQVEKTRALVDRALARTRPAGRAKSG